MDVRRRRRLREGEGGGPEDLGRVLPVGAANHPAGAATTAAAFQGSRGHDALVAVLSHALVLLQAQCHHRAALRRARGPVVRPGGFAATAARPRLGS